LPLGGIPLGGIPLHDPAQRFYTCLDKNNARPTARQTTDIITTDSTE
jgi:hypothetical protein